MMSSKTECISGIVEKTTVDEWMQVLLKNDLVLAVVECNGIEFYENRTTNVTFC